MVFKGVGMLQEYVFKEIHCIKLDTMYHFVNKLFCAPCLCPAFLSQVMLVEWEHSGALRARGEQT